MKHFSPKTTTGGPTPVPHQEVSVEHFFTEKPHLSAAPRFADAEVVTDIVLAALLAAMVILWLMQPGTPEWIGSKLAMFWPPAPIQFILNNGYLGLHIAW